MITMVFRKTVYLFLDRLCQLLVGRGEKKMTKKVLSLVFVCLSITKLSAAMIYDTGSLVGIGTDSPEQNLHIHDYNGSAQLRLERTGRSAGHIDVGADEQGFHIFDDSFQKVFTVKKDGKLGVGTTAPYRPGHFVQNGGSAQLRLERRGNSEGYMDIGADNQGFHVFHDGSTYLTTVSPDGDYGIGTKQPKSALHVKSGRNRVVTVEGEFPDSHSYSYMSFKNNSNKKKVKNVGPSRESNPDLVHPKHVFYH